jgi:cell division protein FtsI/penicillin-binding protein 2
MSRFSKLRGVGRTRILAGLFFILFITLIFRLFILQVSNGIYYSDLARDQHAFFARLTPVRGEIKVSDKLTTEVTPVATNIESPLVYVSPKEVVDSAATARQLAPLLGISENDLLPKLLDKTKAYIPLKRSLVQKDVDAINALHLAGIHMDSETIRFYPEREFLSHVVGFLGYRADTGSQKVGVYGLERKLDSVLGGVAGQVRANSGFFHAGSDFQPAQNGNQLVLSIDHSIQLQVEQILNKAVVDNLAEGGCAVVMDPKTGAILAMASNPTFDPNE